MVFDRNNVFHYNWGKKFENEWIWVTMAYSREKGGIFYYLNGELILQMNGIKQNLPFPFQGELRSHDSIKPFILGHCNHTNTYYKGKIAEVKIYDTFFDNIEDSFTEKNNLLLHCDFNDDSLFEKNNIEFTKESIEVTENILPYRREGKFYCLPHVDEGYVNGTWSKGETTARNEKRFVTEMQQRKIDYKNDGINKILEVMDIENVDDTQYPNTKFINVKMK